MVLAGQNTLELSKVSLINSGHNQMGIFQLESQLQSNFITSSAILLQGRV